MRLPPALIVVLALGCSSPAPVDPVVAEIEPVALEAEPVADPSAPVTLFVVRGRMNVSVEVGGTTHDVHALLYDGGVRTTDIPTLRGLHGATNIVHESWRADTETDAALAQAITSGPFHTEAPYTEVHFSVPDSDSDQVTVDWRAGGRDRSVTASAEVDTSSTDVVVHIGPIDLADIWTTAEQRDVTRSVGARGGTSTARLELVLSADARRAGVGARAPATTAMGDSDPRPLWEEHPIRSGSTPSSGASGGGPSNDLIRELEDGLTPEFVERTGR